MQTSGKDKAISSAKSSIGGSVRELHNRLSQTPLSNHERQGTFVHGTCAYVHRFIVRLKFGQYNSDQVGNWLVPHAHTFSQYWIIGEG